MADGLLHLFGCWFAAKFNITTISNQNPLNLPGLERVSLASCELFSSLPGDQENGLVEINNSEMKR